MSEVPLYILIPDGKYVWYEERMVNTGGVFFFFFITLKPRVE